MSRPAVLILDEPSIGLDPLVQQEFQAMLREVREDGRTVFLSSHTLSEVERVADRVGIIRHGRLVVVEAVDSLKAKAIRRLTLDFGTPVSTEIFEGVAGIHDVVTDGTSVSLSVDGPMRDVLRKAMAHDLVNVESNEADLEEIFLAYYRDPEDEKVTF